MSAIPYHELVAEVERLRGQVESLLPFGQVMLAAENRASASETRAQDAEREKREAERLAEGALGTVEDLRERIARLQLHGDRESYRRGYGAGYSAARRGAASDPDGANRNGRPRLLDSASPRPVPPSVSSRAGETHDLRDPSA